MGRIRSVKPIVSKNALLYDTEQETGLPIRFSWVMLWTQCDRAGRFKWRPRELKIEILPHDNVDFSRVLDALWTRGFVRKYRVDGEDYGFIPSWEKHQIINNRESASDLPEPSEAFILQLFDASSTRDYREDHAITKEVEECKAEGKGREGKGREVCVQKQARVDTADDFIQYVYDGANIPGSPLLATKLSLAVGCISRRDSIPMVEAADHLILKICSFKKSEAFKKEKVNWLDWVSGARYEESEERWNAPANTNGFKPATPTPEWAYNKKK